MAAAYKVRVATGNYLSGGTTDSISITLVGSRGESGKFPLDKCGRDFSPGEVDEYKVESQQDLGPILLIRLHKERYGAFPQTSWNCSFREGAARTVGTDAENPSLLQHRQKELQAKREAYRYKEYQPGWPLCLDADTVDHLHLNDRYSRIKENIFQVQMAAATNSEMTLITQEQKLCYIDLSIDFHIAGGNPTALNSSLPIYLSHQRPWPVNLFSTGGLIEQATGSGFHGVSHLLAKGLSTLTYSALCLPDDLRERGVESLPNYYYKDDAMKLWEAIESFVSGIVALYYKSDSAVKEDSEVQAWVAEILEKCFFGKESSGFPSHLETIRELTKYLTMVIFTSSVRHASVNNGQFDFGAWMPNYPSSMRKPPPKSKGSVTFGDVLDTLPDVSTTCSTLLILWLLSREPGDRRPLGCYPDEHFTEEGAKGAIVAFQRRLVQISKEIEERNKGLPLTYHYLCPKEIENSTSI